MTPLAAYVLLFVAVGVGFIFVHLVAGKLIRPSKPDPEKGTIYECGEPTIGSAWVQFDLRFYVVALLFVIFDVEVAFFFPWAEVFGKTNAIANAERPTTVAEYREYAARVLDLTPPATSSRQHQKDVERYQAVVARNPDGTFRFDDETLNKQLAAQRVIERKSTLLAALTRVGKGEPLSQEQRDTLETAVENELLTADQKALVEKADRHAVLNRAARNQILYPDQRALLTKVAQEKLTDAQREALEKVVRLQETRAKFMDEVNKGQDLPIPVRNVLVKAVRGEKLTGDDQRILDGAPEARELLEKANQLEKPAPADLATIATIAQAKALTAAEKAPLAALAEANRLNETAKDGSRSESSEGQYRGPLRQGEFEKNQEAARTLSWLALGEVLVFFGVLLVGFAYLWRRGDLQWVRSTAAERPETAVTRSPDEEAGLPPEAKRETVGAGGHP